MESADCRRRSDAEQSEWSYNSVKCEPVKEEPEWGEAVAEGLYASHQVKDELVVGPEFLQPQDISFSMQSALNTTEESPCRVKLEGGAGAAPECTNTHLREASHCISQKQQFKLESPVTLEPIDMEDSPTCKTCLMTFDCESSLRNHSCAHSVEESNFYKDACDENAKTYSKCDNCGQQYLQTRHVETGSEKQLRFSSELNKCDLCKGTNLTVDKRVHTTKMFACDICSKPFSNQSKLSTHMRIHTGEKPFSCDVCKKQYLQKWSLKRHIQIHMTGKSYECDVCEKKFSQKTSLTEHVRIHSGVKMPCDVCKKQFTHKSALAKHKKIHSGDKPYSCPVCKKQFVRKSNLPRHMQTHTGHKMYSCNICEKRFAQKDYLTKHIRLHTGEKPFTCDVCKKQFTQKSILTSHLITHGEKQYSCDVCNKAFARKDGLNKHSRTHMGIIYLYVSANR